MPFLRFQADKHEWGFEVDVGYIPAVGDTVLLGYGRPDEEANECVHGVITRRHWGFLPDYRQPEEIEEEIEFDVELESLIPNNYIADSTAWPAKEHSRRVAKLKHDLEHLRTTGRLPPESVEKTSP